MTFDIVPDTFDGTPAELLDQIEKVTSRTGDPTFQVDGDPATITTPAGDVGVIQTYSSVNGDGLVAAFVIDGTGLEITVYGPPAQMTAAADDIHDMIASIRSSGRCRMSSHSAETEAAPGSDDGPSSSGRRPGGLGLGRAVRLRPTPQPLLLGLPVAHRGRRLPGLVVLRPHGRLLR